jgi:hypothetical protein
MMTSAVDDGARSFIPKPSAAGFGIDRHATEMRENPERLKAEDITAP